MTKIVLMIDGGFLRVKASKAGIKYNPQFIDSFMRICAISSEELLRTLYYDCAPYQGQQHLPVSGKIKNFTGSTRWLEELAKKDLMAVRLGVLKFRGFKLKNVPSVRIAPLTDEDFYPDFEQKGVDMRIGLDIANYASIKTVDRIVLVTADTDCVPAMNLARTSGVQVVLIALPGMIVPSELAQHSDLVRSVDWNRICVQS